MPVEGTVGFSVDYVTQKARLGRAESKPAIEAVYPLATANGHVRAARLSDSSHEVRSTSREKRSYAATRVSRCWCDGQ
jgi:hypothetical protein